MGGDTSARRCRASAFAFNVRACTRAGSSSADCASALLAAVVPGTGLAESGLTGSVILFRLAPVLDGRPVPGGGDRDPNGVGDPSTVAGACTDNGEGAPGGAGGLAPGKSEGAGEIVVPGGSGAPGG